MVNALDFDSGYPRSNRGRSEEHWSVAQLVEQLTVNQLVASSNLAIPEQHIVTGCSSKAERMVWDHKAGISRFPTQNKENILDGYIRQLFNK